MNGNEHINFAIYSTTLLGAGLWIGNNLYLYDINFDKMQILDIVVGIGVGSLLPDLDHKNSILGRYSPIPLLHNLFRRMKIYIFKHGGITHTILINIWIFIFAYIFKSLLVAGIAFGYATHLYVDNLDGNKLNMLYWPLILNRGRGRR